MASFSAEKKPRWADDEEEDAPVNNYIFPYKKIHVFIFNCFLERLRLLPNQESENSFLEYLLE